MKFFIIFSNVMFGLFVLISISEEWLSNIQIVVLILIFNFAFLIMQERQERRYSQEQLRKKFGINKIDELKFEYEKTKENNERIISDYAMKYIEKSDVESGLRAEIKELKNKISENENKKESYDKAIKRQMNNLYKMADEEMMEKRFESMKRMIEEVNPDYTKEITGINKLTEAIYEMSLLSNMIIENSNQNEDLFQMFAEEKNNREDLLKKISRESGKLKLALTNYNVQYANNGEEDIPPPLKEISTQTKRIDELTKKITKSEKKVDKIRDKVENHNKNIETKTRNILIQIGIIDKHVEIMGDSGEEFKVKLNDMTREFKRLLKEMLEIGMEVNRIQRSEIKEKQKEEKQN